MKAEWVEDRIYDGIEFSKEALEYFTDYRDSFDVSIPAKEIAERCEEELAASEAKVAVMTEALEEIRNTVGNVSLHDEMYDVAATILKMGATADAALSAAPKVGWVGKGDIEHTLLADYTYTTILCPTHIGKDGQQVTVYVVTDKNQGG